MARFRPRALAVALLLVAASAVLRWRRAPVVVLFDARTPALFPRCPWGRCRAVPIDGFVCPAGARADTVIVSGHSDPPSYLGQPPRAVAAAVACFRPSLVVLDTCYGASLPLLSALAAARVDGVVVAAPFMLPKRGLHYRAGFFSPWSAWRAPERRAALVQTWRPARLLRWGVAEAPLADAARAAAAWDAGALRGRLRLDYPPLVRVPFERGQEILVPVEAARLTPGPGREVSAGASRAGRSDRGS